MRVVSTILLLFALQASAGATAADNRGKPVGATVNDLIEFALANNPTLVAARREIEAARQRVVPAGSLPDPSIRGGLPLRSPKGGMDDGSTTLSGIVSRIELSQTIPLWGKRDLRRGIAQTEADQIAAERLGEVVALVSRIKGAYAQRYFLMRSRRINEEILTVLKTAERLAQERYAAGAASQQDVIRAQTQSAMLRTELVTQDAALRQAQARINSLVGRPTLAPLAEPRESRVVSETAEMDFVWLAVRLRTTNPELFSQEKRIKLAALRRDLTDKNRYPDLTLGTSFIQIMVDLINIPLQRESRRAQEKEARLMVAVEQARRKALQNQLFAELVDRLASVDAARKLDAIGQNSLQPQARLIFDASMAEYDSGKGNFNALLDAQIQILKTKQERLKAQVEQQTHLAEIERLLGEKL